jgi:uncharacterized protein
MGRLTVHVSPGAERSELVGRHGAGWRVRVAARPERGHANDALVALLAAVLGVSRDRIAVVAGRTSRRKLVEVDGLGEDELERRLGQGAKS